MPHQDLKDKETENIAETIAREIKTPIEICREEHIKRIATPPGWNVIEYNDEKLLEYPTRIKGNVVTDDTDSFINYVMRHKDNKSSTVYCNANYENNTINFTSVIDDNYFDFPMWRDHTVSFTPTTSVEYRLWTENNNKLMSQFEFASFIESNLDDIASVENMPTGGQLLDMALQFEASQDMRLKSHIRLQNGGVQMQFVQNDDDATITRMTMFDKLAVGIPVFWNSEHYQINARLRYRVREGQAKFWFELIKPEKVFEAACETIISRIQNETGLPFFFGKWA